MIDEETKSLVELFKDKRNDFEKLIMKAQFILNNVPELMEHLINTAAENERLEAENARLKKQCAHLANDVIAAAQDYGAPMSDCRSCGYDRYCERKPGQIEPNWDMCEAAVLKSCEPENCE